MPDGRPTPLPPPLFQEEFIMLPPRRKVLLVRYGAYFEAGKQLRKAGEPPTHLKAPGRSETGSTPHRALRCRTAPPMQYLPSRLFPPLPSFFQQDLRRSESIRFPGTPWLPPPRPPRPPPHRKRGGRGHPGGQPRESTPK